MTYKEKTLKFLNEFREQYPNVYKKIKLKEDCGNIKLPLTGDFENDIVIIAEIPLKDIQEHCLDKQKLIDVIKEIKKGNIELKPGEVPSDAVIRVIKEKLEL